MKYAASKCGHKNLKAKTGPDNAVLKSLGLAAEIVANIGQRFGLNTNQDDPRSHAGVKQTCEPGWESN